jgi:hypothetical protein
MTYRRRRVGGSKHAQVEFALVTSARAARIALLALAVLAALAAFAPSAFAADGVGVWGPTDDKVVTYWGFGCIAFFAVLVTVLSLIQSRLENRKERLRQEIERLRPPAAD